MNSPATVQRALLGIGFCLIPLGALCVITMPLQFLVLLAIAIIR